MNGERWIAAQPSVRSDARQKQPPWWNVRSGRVSTCGFGDVTEQDWLNSMFSQIQALGSVMGIALTTNQAFDDYAATCGWAYDNGGHYRGQLWDWYVDRESGIVLLRQDPDRVFLVRFQGTTLNELWSGYITTSTDFDQLMERLAHFKPEAGT